MKVLLVEDNDQIRSIVSRRFAREGHQVVSASDGASGVAMASVEMPQVILMDLSLPVLDGWEAMRRLKAAPETAAIPVIALTAHALSEDRDSARLAGASDFVTKPIDFAKLFASVQRLGARPSGVEP